MEVRQVAGGYRMGTKPEHHDVVRQFAKSLKPPVRLSLPALETLAVVAYKQPVTAPEISEIRGVDCSGVLATLLDRKLITTAGRKQVIGRPILYKTSKEFLLRFGLKDVTELPSLEEFEKLAGEGQEELFPAAPPPDASPETAPVADPRQPVENVQAEAQPEPSATPTPEADSRQEIEPGPSVDV
jgi:segregation and condensation protein B